ncbi:MAG TPA: DinB family protein [Fimbriimonadales bacterium]|nr:DinB family protein [Fimbriimonadales bacterium]
MNAIDTLLRAAEYSYSELLEALDGVSEKLSWAVLPQGGADYLHSDGSIHGIVLHIATCKIMYASAAFRNAEILWRDCAKRVETFEPNWKAALDYLAEAHQYWVSSWENLKDDDLDVERIHTSGNPRPTWKIIYTVIQHDSYHAGQIAMLRYALTETDKHPPSVAEDIRKYCANEPFW